MMGLSAILCKTNALAMALALQGDTSSDLTDAQAMTVGFIFIAIAFVVVAVGIWMTIDAWVNYGPGWGAGAGAGCFITSVLGAGVGGCLVIIPYLILRFAILPPRLYRERMAGAMAKMPPSYPAPGIYPPPGSAPQHYTPQPQQVPPGLELAPLEQDERINCMLDQGQAREAMDYAQQMYKMALDFHDRDGMTRYAKYIERIRRGIK